MEEPVVGSEEDDEGSEDELEDQEGDDSAENAQQKLKSRGIGVTRDRRLKTIQQTAAANEAAQANAIALNEKSKAAAKLEKKTKKKDPAVKVEVQA